jgi:glycosyltransferase involved in cell wall biosynthesis
MAPRITVVTPSFNQGRFLEQTILSVLEQNYPNVEYFVVDGGSSDNSVDIIRKYSSDITWWVSERDKGQTDALIKGFSRASGDVLGWINSDDFLEPGALNSVGLAYGKNPGSLIAGNVKLFSDSTGRERLLRQRRLEFEHMVRIWTRRSFYSQPGVFFPRSAYIAAGGLDRSLHYCMDHDLMVRLLRTCPVHYLDDVLARARQHAASKTCSQSGHMVAESCVVARRYLSEVAGGGRLLSAWCLKAYILRCAVARLYHGAPAAVWPVLKELGRSPR